MSAISITENEAFKSKSLLAKFKDFEMFEKLKKALDTSEGLKNIERTTTEHCDTGCFYDLSEDRQKTMKLDVTTENITRLEFKQKFHMSEPIFNTNSDGSQTCFLYVTYEDYKENLDIKETSSQPNIKDTIYTHFVSSRIMGFQAVIELSVSKYYNGPDFKNIFKILLGQSTLEKSLNLSEVLISVSGNLPLDFKYDCSTLNNESLKSLQNLCDAKFYESLKMRLLMRVGISPLDLESYFNPLFEKLAALKEIECSERFTSPQWIIDCIKKEVLQKIITAAELIKSGKDYLPMSQFLQNVYRSVLLNKAEMESLITSLNEVVTKEVANLQSIKYMNKGSPYTEDFNLTVLYKISLSLDKHQNSLIESIAEFFESNGKEKVYQNKMVKLFEESLQEDCTNIRSKVEEKDVMRCNLQEAMGKNVKINCEVTTSSCLIDSTQFEVKLCQKGVPIDPQIPVLDPPFDIKMTKATQNCITITWSMPEEVNSNLVRYYRIDCRRVNGKSFGQWRTIFTDKPELEGSVDDLQSGGTYMFRVQTWFLDFVGVWSDNSKPFRTKMNVCEKHVQTTTIYSSICEKHVQTTTIYSSTLKTHIGKPLAELPNMGPILGLNEDGECCFHQRHDSQDFWNNNLNNCSQLITTRPILLSDEMSGMIVVASIYPYPQSGFSFYVRLVAPQCAINRPKRLPISINLKIKIALTTGGYHTSDNYKFTITVLCNLYLNQNFASPNNFLVTVPNNGTRPNNQPEIILQFSQ